MSRLAEFRLAVFSLLGVVLLAGISLAYEDSDASEKLTSTSGTPACTTTTKSGITYALQCRTAGCHVRVISNGSPQTAAQTDVFIPADAIYDVVMSDRKTVCVVGDANATVVATLYPVKL